MAPSAASARPGAAASAVATPGASRFSQAAVRPTSFARTSAWPRNTASDGAGTAPKGPATGRDGPGSSAPSSVRRAPCGPSTARARPAAELGPRVSVARVPSSVWPPSVAVSNPADRARRSGRLGANVPSPARRSHSATRSVPEGGATLPPSGITASRSRSRAGPCRVSEAEGGPSRAPYRALPSPFAISARASVPARSSTSEAVATSRVAARWPVRVQGMVAAVPSSVTAPVAVALPSKAGPLPPAAARAVAAVPSTSRLGRRLSASRCSFTRSEPRSNVPVASRNGTPPQVPVALKGPLRLAACPSTSRPASVSCRPSASASAIVPSRTPRWSTATRSAPRPSGSARSTDPSGAWVRSSRGRTQVVSTTWTCPRSRDVKESSASSASALSRGRPPRASPIATRPKRNRGVGRILRSMSPATVTGVPRPSDNRCSTRARWLLQSTRYGPTRAAVSTPISRMARTVRLSRKAVSAIGERGTTGRNRPADGQPNAKPPAREHRARTGRAAARFPLAPPGEAVYRPTTSGALRSAVRALRLAVQDVALSRRKQGFDSPRARQSLS